MIWNDAIVWQATMPCGLDLYMKEICVHLPCVLFSNRNKDFNKNMFFRFKYYQKFVFGWM